MNNSALRPLHLRILFPYLLTLPKTDPRRYVSPKDITGSKAIDLELYTYIALLMRDFIHPWYRLITNDQDLTSEILHVLIKVIQKLEDRLCEVDWTELMLIDLPKLLSIHYHDFRQAKTRLYMDHGSGSSSLLESFHGIQPHFALNPIGNREQEYLRLVTEAVLKVLLEPDDFNSNCVRHLIRDILGNMVLSSVIDSLSDPYTIHMIISKLLATYEPLLDDLEATGQFSETYFSALTNNPLHTKNKTSADEVKTSMSDSNLSPAEEESLTKQMQRLQEKRRLQGDAVDEVDEPSEQSKTTRRHFSFGYITLQVILSPIRTLWLYILAALTQSQERYYRVNEHKKRTRQVQLVEPAMEFIRIACQVEDNPMLNWAWQMFAMFFWPIVRVLGGGTFVDK
ncbi:PXA domain-containing protein [Pilobolus umbonatus]|nr:PXA domain-containing protein [Pilobolus umbonatus]